MSPQFGLRDAGRQSVGLHYPDDIHKSYRWLRHGMCRNAELHCTVLHAPRELAEVADTARRRGTPTNTGAHSVLRSALRCGVHQLGCTMLLQVVRVDGVRTGGTMGVDALRRSHNKRGRWSMEGLERQIMVPVFPWLR